MNKINLTDEQAVALQRSVDDHMDLCSQVIDYEGEDLPEYLEDVSMYCGCHVCHTREYLLATFNYLRDAGIVDIAVE